MPITRRNTRYLMSLPPKQRDAVDRALRLRAEAKAEARWLAYLAILPPHIRAIKIAKAKARLARQPSAAEKIAKRREKLGQR